MGVKSISLVNALELSAQLVEFSVNRANITLLLVKMLLTLQRAFLCIVLGNFDMLKQLGVHLSASLAWQEAVTDAVTLGIPA